MNETNIIPFIIGGITIILIFLSFYFKKKAIIKRKLKKAPHKRIYHFRNGEVAKFTGVIEAVDGQLTAPLSKRKCSYYHIIVEQRVSTGKSSRWKKIIEETKSNKFVIRDSSACAYIDSNEIKSHIVFDKKYSSGFLNDASNDLENYLRKHGRESESFLGFNKTIRYREGILEEREKVAVLGKGKWIDGEELGLPKKYDRILSITNHEVPIYLSDDPETTVRNQNRNSVR